MKQVFISYTRRNEYDKQFADYLRGQLMAWGYRPWMDVYDIPKGAHWDDTIDEALKSSDVVLGLVTSAAIESDNVKNEWAWASQKGKLQLLYLQHCDVPHRFIRIDYIDFTNPNNQQAMWAKLYDVLARSMPGGQASPASSTPTRPAVGSVMPSSRAAQATPPPSAQIRSAAPARPAAGGTSKVSALLIGVVAGVAIIGIAAIVLLNALVNGGNLGGGGGRNNAAANAESFLRQAFQGNVAGAAALVCPQWQANIRLELNQIVISAASFGGLSLSDLACRVESDTSVRCRYTVTANATGFSEPVNIAIPMQDGLVCTASLTMLSTN
jgi:hypothetical protein